MTEATSKTMKSLKILWMMAVLVCCCVTTSCGDDDDEPGGQSNNLVTDYGVATSTGKCYMRLWASEKDGNSELNIPGFPTLIIVMTWNYYPHIQSIDEKVEFHSAESLQSGDWVTETSISGGNKLYARIPVKNASKNNQEYVYAYIESLETLNNPEHFRAGVRLMYESPVIPE